MCVCVGGGGGTWLRAPCTRARATPTWLTPPACRAALGKRPLECWQAVADILGIDATAQQLVDASVPLLAAK